MVKRDVLLRGTIDRQRSALGKLGDMMVKPRNILITGGASGIGAAVADAFVAAGDHVTVFDRDGAESSDITSVMGDVRSYPDLVHAAEIATGESGLDVLIANAGVHDGGRRLLDGDPGELEASFRAVFDIDVVGYLLTARAAAPELRRAGGCIVVTLSDASFDVQGNGAGIAYVAAKHAGLGLVRALARDLAPDIRVNAVAPGGIATSLQATDGAGGHRQVISDPDRLAHTLATRTLLGHGAGLDDLAATYLYFCSPAAASVTGQILRVDGGLLS